MTMKSKKPLVGIIMGSDSDWTTLEPAVDICEEFSIPYEVQVVSAHRTPDEMARYGKNAIINGLRVIIAAAGGAAHLPGMVASHTTLPVIGVPVKSKSLQGLDSLLSIVQMPGGVPVATVAIDGGKNAGLLAVQILASGDNKLTQKMLDYKKSLNKESKNKNKSLQNNKKRKKTEPPKTTPKKMDL